MDKKASSASSTYSKARMIGQGSFSSVFEGSSPSQPVALKYAKSHEGTSLLAKEAEVMRQLSHCQSTRHAGVPKLLDCYPDCLVMQRVGRTLHALCAECKTLSVKTVLMVAVKAISALEEIHSCGFVHGDIKPDNIAVGLQSSDPRIYLIDLGLSVKYLICGSHVSYNEKCKFQGTPFFCSNNNLRHIRPSRRDDLEALGYVLVYLMAGRLPWFVCDPSRSTFLQDVLDVRECTPLQMLCEGVEPEFREYLEYCQNLAFADKPNYEMLRGKFECAARRLRIKLDWEYDWAKKRKHRHTFEKAQSAHCCTKESRKSLRLLSETLMLSKPELQSKACNLPDLQATPVHKVNQLPAFRRHPNSALDTEVVEFDIFVHAPVLHETS